MPALLTYVNTSVASHARAVDRAEDRYAADAGIEWLAADLINSDLTAYDGQWNTDIYGGDAVNSLTPEVQITSKTSPSVFTRTYTVTSCVDGTSISAVLSQIQQGTGMTIDMVSWQID